MGWLLGVLVIAVLFSLGKSAAGGVRVAQRPGEAFLGGSDEHRKLGLSTYRAPEGTRFRWTVRASATEDYSAPVLATGLAASEGAATQAAFDWIDLVISATPSDPLVLRPDQKVEERKPIEQGAVPEGLEQGGAPLLPGFVTLEPWYRYKGRWIRVDRGPTPSPEIQRRTASGLPDGGPWMHYAKSYRRFRWTVVAGDSPTPLATGETISPTEVGVFGDYPSITAVEDARADYTARLAADWIDLVTSPRESASSGVPSPLAGAPVGAGWQTVGWYTYKGRWIRIDENPAAAKITWSPVAWPPELRGHAVIIHYDGELRWTVLAGDSTPIATGIVRRGDYIGDHLGRADGEHNADTKAAAAAKDDAIDHVARNAADWIDITVGA